MGIIGDGDIEVVVVAAVLRVAVVFRSNLSICMFGGGICGVGSGSGFNRGYGDYNLSHHHNHYYYQQQHHTAYP